MLGAAFLLMGLHAACSSEPVAKDGRALELRWRAHPSCPVQGEIEAEIERLLAKSEVQRSELRVDAKVVQQGEGFRLELTVLQDGELGQRRLEAPKCEALADATALIVATAVDPWVDPGIDSAPSSDESPPSVPKPVTEPEPTPPVEETPPVAAVSRRFVPHAVGHVAGGLSVALAPSLGGALQSGIGLRWRRVQVSAVANGWLPRRVRASTNDAIAAKVQMWTGGVLVCPLVRAHERVTIPLCVGVHAGAMLARGTDGVVSARRAREPWAGFSVSPALVVAASDWLGVRLGADVFASVLRPAFATSQGTRVFRAGLVGATFNLGIEFGSRPRR